MLDREFLLRLAGTYGTPLFVYDGDMVLERYRDLFRFIRYPGLRIHYALKANYNVGLLKMLRDAGAAEIHMRISAPPFKHSCHFGTDIDDEEKLIANKMSVDEIAKFIGADSLGYISIEGVKQACSGCSLGLCTGCFDGDYPMHIGHHTKAEFEC